MGQLIFPPKKRENYLERKYIMNNLSLIAAVSEDWAIGKDGDLLFSIKEDMKFFRQTTMDNVVIMGRKTLESFPGQKPLKNRVNIVLTRNKNYSAEGAVIVTSLDELAEELKKYPDKEHIVIGGGEIYSLLMPYCTKAYITKVAAKKDADTYLENLDKDSTWSITNAEEHSDENYNFTFTEYSKEETK